MASIAMRGCLAASPATVHRHQRGAQQPVQRPVVGRFQQPGRQVALHARAEREDSSGEVGFTAGFIVGGVVFGTLGFLFAPQISKALLGDDQRLWLPRFLDDEQAAKDPEQTKQELIEKIAQLNASIDEVSNQLKGKDDIRSNGTGALPKAEAEGLKIVA